MKKSLKLPSVDRTYGLFTFMVQEQSHCGVNFGEGVDTFSCKNGITLCASGRPSWDKQNNILFLWGQDSERDLGFVTVGADEFERIQQSVAEYVNFDFKD